jgi:hypothetical protein
MKVDLLAEGGGQDRRKPSLDTLLGHCPSRPVVDQIQPAKPAPGPLGHGDGAHRSASNGW